VLLPPLNEDSVVEAVVFVVEAVVLSDEVVSVVSAGVCVIEIPDV
jgi:hypothetical protein